MLDALAALAQIALYVGVLLACGAVFAQATLRVKGAIEQALLKLSQAGAVVTIVATLGGTLVLIQRLGGTFDEPTISAVLMSSVGAAGGMRVVGALLLLATPPAEDDTFVRGMRLSYAAVLAASFLFIGHGAAASFAAGLMTSLHVTIAGWWLVSLLALRRACRWNAAGEVATLVDRFSRIAVIAIGLLVIAGIVLIATLIDFPIIELSPYIATLAVKIGAAMLVFAVAAYNKFRLTPRVLEADVGAIRSLRVAVNVELLLLGGILIATTLMTTYNAPQE